MKRIGLLGSSSLLGEELKTELGRHSALWEEIRLLTFDEESSGKVADLDGAATFVRSVDEESLAGLDLVVVPGERVAGRGLETLVPGETPLLVVAPVEPIEGMPLVDGLNIVDGQLPADVAGRRVYVSPHPVAIALALILGPLEALAVERASGTALLPSSIRGQKGLDELLEQSRRLLAFQSEMPQDVFGRQLAFNVLPMPGAERVVQADLTGLLGERPDVSVRHLQASVFHGCSLTLHLEFADSVEATSVREALSGAAHLDVAEGELSADDPSPIEAAGRDDVQVYGVEAAGSRVSLQAVFDHLTRGGALNALAILTAFADQKPN